MKTEFIVVLVTVSDESLGTMIARSLVEEGLAACVNIVPGLRSIYVFGGELCDDAEVLCVIKTRAERFDELAERISTLHPYDVPEIISLPLQSGNASYLRWVREATASSSET